MNPDHERWAEALIIDRQHGDEAPEHIAARIRDLALVGDEAGVQRWMEIAGRYDQLRDVEAERH